MKQMEHITCNAIEPTGERECSPGLAEANGVDVGIEALGYQKRDGTGMLLGLGSFAVCCELNSTFR
jgi:hypothetical protein